MTVVTALVVGYLFLSLFATIILISACVVGGRFDKLYKRSSELVESSCAVEMSAEAKPETNPEAMVAHGDLNRLMPQLIRQVTE